MGQPPHFSLEVLYRVRLVAYTFQGQRVWHQECIRTTALGRIGLVG